jgi:hypothetical protein
MALRRECYVRGRTCGCGVNRRAQQVRAGSENLALRDEPFYKGDVLGSLRREMASLETKVVRKKKRRLLTKSALPTLLVPVRVISAA